MLFVSMVLFFVLSVFILFSVLFYHCLHYLVLTVSALFISVFVSSFYLCFSCGYKCFCPSVVCVIRVHYAMFCVISILHYHVIKKM